MVYDKVSAFCVVYGSLRCRTRRKRKIRTLFQSETGSDFSCFVDLIGFEPTTPTMRMWCAPNCATGPNALSKTILYQENLKSKVFFEEKTGKILEAGREIEKPCVKNRKRSERFLRELLDSFGKMMYNTSQQSARYRIGVGHGRTSRGDSGALYLQSAVAGMNPGPPEASCFVSCR